MSPLANIYEKTPHAINDHYSAERLSMPAIQLQSLNQILQNFYTMYRNHCRLPGEIAIAMFQFVSKRQCVECRTIVKLQPSRGKIPQTPFLNSEVTGPMFVKFLHNVPNHRHVIKPLNDQSVHCRTPEQRVKAVNFDFCKKNKHNWLP